MRRIEIAKILRNESDFLAKYFLSKLSEIPNFNSSTMVQSFNDKEINEAVEGDDAATTTLLHS